jgi:tripartite ATP-independent transporter DctP family solute receptor
VSDQPSRRRFLTAGFTAALLTRTPPAFAQTQTFKLAHPDTNQHPAQKVAERFAAEVARRTNGRIQIHVYPAGTLGSEINIIQGLQTGIIDFAMHTSGYLESFVPTIQVLDLPFLFKDSNAAQRVLDGEPGKELASDLLAKNIVHLAWGHYGWRQVETTDKVVRTASDMKNVKIRIQAGPLFASMFKAVGAVPVVIDAGDVYIALQQKTVDACEFPFLAYVTNKIYEVAKHVAKTQHVYNAGALMASKPKFDALSAADQQIVRSAGAGQTAFWRNLVAETDAKFEKQMAARGIQITTTDFASFRAAMNPVYAEFKPKYPQLFDEVVAAAS